MEKDREPRYQVDGISRVGFYRESDSEVRCYRF